MIKKILSFLKSIHLIKHFFINTECTLQDDIVSERYLKIQTLLIEIQKDNISTAKFFTNIFFILNGASITALVSKDFVFFMTPIKYFTCGVLFSALMIVVSYVFNTSSVFRLYDYLVCDKETFCTTIRKFRREITIFTIIMYISFIISVIFFIYGVENVFVLYANLSKQN